jgi:hypothetical protein
MRNVVYVSRRYELQTIADVEYSVTHQAAIAPRGRLLGSIPVEQSRGAWLVESETPVIG